MFHCQCRFNTAELSAAKHRDSEPGSSRCASAEHYTPECCGVCRFYLTNFQHVSEGSCEIQLSWFSKSCLVDVLPDASV